MGHGLPTSLPPPTLKRTKTLTRVWLDDSPITAGDHDGNPTWSPNGRQLAFTSRRGEKKGDSTLHVIRVDGPGETRTLCTMADGLGSLAWSPDGKWIAFNSRTQDERYTKEDASWQAPRKVERFFARLNGEDWIFDRPEHVYVVAADGTGSARNLTPGEFEHGGAAWLMDSSGIITSATRHETWDVDLAKDLYLVPLDADADPDTIRCLTNHDGDYSLPSVSPDGSHIAFIGHGELATYPQNASVGVLPVSAARAAYDDIVWASQALDRTFHPTVGVRPPVWEDPKTLLATAEDRGSTHLYRFSSDGSSAPEAVTEGAISIQSFDAAGGVIARCQTSTKHPAELFVDDEQRTSVSARFSEGLLDWEKYTVPTIDGTDEIDCWITRPVDFDPSKTYPVLLNVHGGPFTQYGEYFFDEFQMQAAAGFVVLCGNPRGGSGREKLLGSGDPGY